MAEEDSHQTNDKLFRTTFGVPENAAAFLKAKLPVEVAESVEWTGLQLVPGSFVDSHFRNSHTDLLFSARMSHRDALIYMLFEHQSTKDRWLPLRLLRYMVRIWESRSTSGESKARILPAIIPVVLSQNAEYWDIDLHFAGLLDLPTPLPQELRPFVPDFVYQHIQLADMEFEAMPGTPTGIMVLRVMKAQRLGLLLDDAIWDEDLILRVPTEFFHLLLHYILSADVDREAFEAKVLAISNIDTRSAAMTLAERYHQQGHQQGRQEALQESVLNVLTTRFHRVPDGLSETLLTIGDESKLRALLSAAIVCQCLEEFAERL